MWKLFNMPMYEWVALYFAGIIVAIMGFLGDKPNTITMANPKYRRFVHILSVIFWPILLPFSFIVLFFDLCYLFHWLAPYRYNPFSWMFKIFVRYLQRHGGGWYNAMGKQVIIDD